MEPAIRDILFQLNILGYHVRCEGDGWEVTFIATHRLAGHFFAYTAGPDSAYEAVCILAEMCGLEEFEP